MRLWLFSFYSLNIHYDNELLAPLHNSIINFPSWDYSCKIPRTTLRLQIKLERIHRQKKKTNPLKNKRDHLVDRKKIPSICRKQFTHLQSSNQTYMELRNRTVGLRQQVQHSHHAEISIQNSQSHSKCTPVCNKSYASHRLQHPLS